MFPLFICLLVCGFTAKAQQQDSVAVARTLNDLLTACRKVDFSDPKTSQLGMFYKAAQYIVYQGDDLRRKWRDVANYSNPKEKEQVDNICSEINYSVNQDTAYRITHFKTNTESEGKWYVLSVTYNRKGKEKHANFAFLKLAGGFALGDID